MSKTQSTCGSSEGESLDSGSLASRELAGRVQAGDRAAFQELYDKVAPALYTWTCMRLQGGPAADLAPEDILQEAWLRGLENLASYDPARSFRAWMIGIAKNVLLHAYRRLSRGAERGSGRPLESQLGLLGCPDSVTSISGRLTKDENVQRFLAYVAGLQPDERMLVLYCGFEDYTVAEAATRLGLKPDAASKRWQSLRARMRDSGSLRALALEESA